MSDINLEIITPEKIVYKDSVVSVTVPGTQGSFQVLKDHAPLMSTIDIGLITIDKDGNPGFFTTSGGTIEVLDNKVLILADSVEMIESIDIDRAELAKKRAEERLAKKHEDKIDVARAEAALERAINRIKASTKHR